MKADATGSKYLSLILHKKKEESFLSSCQWEKYCQYANFMHLLIRLLNQNAFDLNTIVPHWNLQGIHKAKIKPYGNPNVFALKLTKKEDLFFKKANKQTLTWKKKSIDAISQQGQIA